MQNRRIHCIINVKSVFHPTEYDTQLLSFNSSPTSSEAASFWRALRWENVFDSTLYPLLDKGTGSGYKVNVKWRKGGKEERKWRKEERGDGSKNKRVYAEKQAPTLIKILQNISESDWAIDNKWPCIVCCSVMVLLFNELSDIIGRRKLHIVYSWWCRNRVKPQDCLQCMSMQGGVTRHSTWLFQVTNLLKYLEGFKYMRHIEIHEKINTISHQKNAN